MQTVSSGSLEHVARYMKQVSLDLAWLNGTGGLLDTLGT